MDTIDLAHSPINLFFIGGPIIVTVGGVHGGLIVSAPDSGANGRGSSSGWGHCVVILGRTLYSHSASRHPGV